METHCLRYTEIPGTSRLFADYQYHFDRVSRYYGQSPHELDALAGPSATEYPEARRRAVVDALGRLNPGAPGLDVLAQPGALAIVTGQQVGLFSGAAYTVYKALTAARLAAELNAAGRPAVAIFWAATEDHDVAEVDHCHVFDAEHRPVGLSGKTRGQAAQPAGTVAMDEPPVEALERALAGLPYGREAAALAREAYPQGVTLGGGFLALTRRLLSRFGLLYLDPLDPAIRAIAAPFLASALEASSELNLLLQHRGRELGEAGYHSQVLVEPESTLFFRLEGARRLALRSRNDSYTAAGGRTYSKQDLASEPAQLSPNALLRPVMQDYLLPTAAYVGGAAEIAYFGQSEVIYRRLLGRMPAIVSRASFTLVPERYRKLMTRYELTIPALLAPAEQVRMEAARHLVSPELGKQYAEARREQAAVFDRLGAATRTFDPTLERAFAKSRAKMEYQLAKMERKVSREALRRDERAGAEVDAMMRMLAPERHLQERYYSYLAFFAEYGEELAGHLYSNVHLSCPDHKVVFV